jgi:hypothetical protein
LIDDRLAALHLFDERIPGECAEGRPSLTLAVQK